MMTSERVVLAFLCFRPLKICLFCSLYSHSATTWIGTYH